VAHFGLLSAGLNDLPIRQEIYAWAMRLVNS
jgi:hypothetical protein